MFRQKMKAMRVDVADYEQIMLTVLILIIGLFENCQIYYDRFLHRTVNDFAFKFQPQINLHRSITVKGRLLYVHQSLKVISISK